MESVINIAAPNGKLIGEAVLLEDGFYHFRLLERQYGFFDEGSLRYIADKLEELNGPYNEQLRQYFDAEKQRNLQTNFNLLTKR